MPSDPPAHTPSPYYTTRWPPAHSHSTTVRPAAPLGALTLLPHARLLALAQPALLALAAHVHVHLTLAAVLADVLGTLDDAAAEEALAAFAAQHVVVEAGGLVATHAAHFISQHLWGWALLPLQGGIFYREQHQEKKKNHTWHLQLTVPFLTVTDILIQTHYLPNIWMKRSSPPFHSLSFWASISSKRSQILT